MASRESRTHALAACASAIPVLHHFMGGVFQRCGDVDRAGWCARGLSFIRISSRAFCPTCGSTLGAIDDAPVVALVTGVFDKPSLAALKPTAHSFKGQRPRWWHIEIDG